MQFAAISRCASDHLAIAMRQSATADVYWPAAVRAEDIPGNRLEQFMRLAIGAMAATAIGLLI